MTHTFRNLYYRVKPLLPWRARAALRRKIMRRQRRAAAGLWPIRKESGVAPPGWRGWPGGKSFALVLTHDVERIKGVTRCAALMELERDLGFRSSFNFVPEGYATPPELRDTLSGNGFEVGVHDLKHDGKLYLSQEAFQEGARRINTYLEQWSAVGFRSAFMLHNLDWLHALNVKYDASTFDVDPFEPQPDGVNTIFPFWVATPPGHSRSQLADTASRSSDLRSLTSDLCPPSSGYVELPYTLAQDSTLFLFLQERTNAIWKQKLDWIVERGGMALINTHPDYMSFNGAARADEFPVHHYAEFLQYVKSRYAGAFWQPLPREMAEFAAQLKDTLRPS